MSASLRLERLDPTRPPVVLLGGINLVRALGEAGIAAIVATPHEDEPALDSRHCAGRWPLPPLGQAAAAESLVGLGTLLARRYGRRVPLMYGSDEALQLVQGHRSRLARYFLFLVCDPLVSAALVAKDRFAAFAAVHGLPVPATLAWARLAAADGPVVAKPRDKADWHASALCQRLFGGDGKALVFASGAEAAAHPEVARAHGELTFQEYVPGGDDAIWSYHGFADASGEVLAEFVGRKVRTYPPDTGESSFIELAQEPALAALGRDIARRCPLKGVFKMDFKRDARDGAFRLLEINARYNLWNYLGALNGVNLMRVAYEHLVDGASPAPTAWRTRRRWLSLALDWKAYRALASRGEARFAAWLASVANPRNAGNLFSWTDPAPWWCWWRRRLARRFTRVPARIASRLRQWRATAS